MSTFITLEGPEGSGKSTQLVLLADALRARGMDVLTTREPGGTRIGNAVRSLLLDPAYAEIDMRTEALLFSAARAQLVQQVIRPALERGQVVLCDRYVDSTLAYQGYGHSQKLEQLRQIARFATGGLQPNLTLLLDLEPRAGLLRKRAGDEWNRMEEQTLRFHERVRRGYCELAAAEPARWCTVDATGAIDVVHDALLHSALTTINSTDASALVAQFKENVQP